LFYFTQINRFIFNFNKLCYVMQRYGIIRIIVNRKNLLVAILTFYN